MIIDKIENLELYTAVVPEFAAIAKYLRETDLASLEEGSYEVCPGVKCNVSEYEPYAAGDKWEVHKKYADLHLVAVGGEKIDCACTLDGEGLGYYSEEDDFMFIDTCGDGITTTNLKPGTFVYCAPHDGHRPGLKWNTDKVKKAVFKIPYNK